MEMKELWPAGTQQIKFPLELLLHPQFHEQQKKVGLAPQLYRQDCVHVRVLAVGGDDPATPDQAVGTLIGS
ncbi:hypothetical protein SKAU_G00130350 [Synaphobranchus kaupii]|uniref:Uncharacterized protein n=1 Tax=Synaphobranchus kaupii TaxID=118154 RepID=A0A9Q1J299_SYNKA|nr:hypothetical protein SKAU_G00130350 [Synaphobranchus kaupii]